MRSLASCAFTSPPLSESETVTRSFYDRWIGGSGFLSALGRSIFRLSGVVYSNAFVRAARLDSQYSVLDIGCGMGTVLVSARKKVKSYALYLGIDLSEQMILRGKLNASLTAIDNPAELLVGSALSLPFGASLFDVVLLSHVIKYLTDDQLNLVLEETMRVLKPRGRIVLWEFNPVFTSQLTRLIVKYSRAQKLRNAAQLKSAMETAGYNRLQTFRIITPWLPWSNVALVAQIN